MMTMAVITSSSSASKYYTADDSGSLDIDSEWFGKGAEEAGFKGKVDPSVFKAVLDGQIAGQQLSTPGGKHKCGWDLTFNAPKSVSILALAGGDDRLIEAHLEASRRTLAHIEENQVITRQSKEGIVRPVNTNNLVSALFTHTSNRNLEPHLHTHSVVANLTCVQDGKWRSIESRPMFERIKLSGQIYRNELAVQIKNLGYELDVDHKTGFFEIKGVPAETIKAFSTRTGEIEQEIAKLGLKTGKAKKIMGTLHTREKKVAVDKEQLQAHWREMLPTSTQAVIDRSINQPPPQADLVNNDVLDEIRTFVKILSERESVFSRDQLKDSVMKSGLGNIREPDIQQGIDRLGELEELLPANIPDNGHHALTTPTAIMQETWLLNQLGEGRGKVRPMMDQTAVRYKSASLVDKPLNEGQKKAVEMICTATDRIVGVQGFAGTGKTYMMEVVNQLAEQHNFTVRGLAPTHNAAQTLQKDSGIRSSTLASFLHRIDQGEKFIGDNELWVLDESSLANTQSMNALLDAAQATGNRVCLVGDVAQIGSVEAGKPFAQMVSHGMTVARMTDIRRQRDQRLLEAVKAAIEVNPERTIDKIRQKGDLVELSDTKERISAIVSDYMSLSDKERKKTLVIVPDNETRRKVMFDIRDRMVKQGQIDETNNLKMEVLVRSGLTKEECKDARFFRSGQVVEFDRDYKKLGNGVQAGDRFHVLSVDEGQGIVRLSPYHGFLDERGGNLGAFDFKPENIRTNGNSLSVYSRESRTFSRNDQVVWNKTRKDQGFKTGDRGQVVRVDESGKLHVEFSDGVREIDPLTMKNLDYGYATTAHSAQGMTYNRVLAMAESFRRNLVNQKTFYVSLSRARHEAKIYTDNAKALASAIHERKGEKTSALESVSSQIADKYSGQVPKSRKSILSDKQAEQKSLFDGLVDKTKRNIEGVKQDAHDLSKGRVRKVIKNKIDYQLKRTRTQQKDGEEAAKRHEKAKKDRDAMLSKQREKNHKQELERARIAEQEAAKEIENEKEAQKGFSLEL